jgi:predicted transcriptional regulator
MTDKENYLLVSFDDKKSKSIAEVIGSKTCKKIISYLSEEKEASQKDLSDELKIPLNTIEYNIKKLLESGFIQKTKNFCWSKKGKKIIMYKLSKRSVIISHKKSNLNKLKSILPAIILGFSATFAIAVYEKIKNTPKDLVARSPELIAKSFETSQSISFLESSASFPIWAWFLLGFLIAIFIISVINWRKL